MTPIRHAIVVLVLIWMPDLAQAQMDETELAKQTQNPIANLISFPIQNNINLGAGSENDVQYFGKFQPIVPINIGDWLVVNRPIIDVVYQPELAPGVGEKWGISDLVYQAYVVPPSSAER